jgi:hypothetical protein
LGILLDKRRHHACNFRDARTVRNADGAAILSVRKVTGRCGPKAGSSKDFQMTKPIDALKTIARYVETKKPKTLAEAEHLLDVISVMADETILDEDAAESSLAKGLISKPFFHRSSHGPSPAGPGRRSAASCILATGAGDHGEYRKAYPRFVASATATRRYSDAACGKKCALIPVWRPTAPPTAPWGADPWSEPAAKNAQLEPRLGRQTLVSVCRRSTQAEPPRQRLKRASHQLGRAGGSQVFLRNTMRQI